MIPKYIKKHFCNDSKVNPCEYFMSKDCPETCGYSKEIMGIGSSDTQTAKRIRKNIEMLLKEDLRDY